MAQPPTPNATTFTGLLDGALRHDDGSTHSLELTVPETWQQGRALFGGLTAALCLEAATPFAEGRPIRTAQITFIGPASGVLTATATPVRVGKNTAFVSVALTNDLGLAASAMMVFGNARQSQHQAQKLVAPESPAPADCGAFIRPDGPAPVGFWSNFETRPAAADDQAMIGNPDYDGHLRLWMRHLDDKVAAGPTINPVAALGLADVPPPAAMPALPVPAPVSSMTWMAEFLTEEITTEDGWFLAHHIDEFALNGYSSQSMTLFNSDRQPIIVGRQSVTVFG